jgi:hypothetical protein
MFIFCSTELLTNCQQLNCQYKCAVARNSTRCYCEEGFEVKEDGRSCKGKYEMQFYVCHLSIAIKKNNARGKLKREKAYFGSQF